MSWAFQIHVFLLGVHLWSLTHLTFLYDPFGVGIFSIELVHLSCMSSHILSSVCSLSIWKVRAIFWRVMSMLNQARLVALRACLRIYRWTFWTVKVLLLMVYWQDVCLTELINRVQPSTNFPCGLVREENLLLFLEMHGVWIIFWFYSFYAFCHSFSLSHYSFYALLLLVLSLSLILVFPSKQKYIDW